MVFRGDEELDTLIKATIAGGGVIPHIHKSLIGKKVQLADKVVFTIFRRTLTWTSLSGWGWSASPWIRSPWQSLLTRRKSSNIPNAKPYVIFWQKFINFCLLFVKFWHSIWHSKTCRVQRLECPQGAKTPLRGEERRGVAGSAFNFPLKKVCNWKKRWQFEGRYLQVRDEGFLWLRRATFPVLLTGHQIEATSQWVAGEGSYLVRQGNVEPIPD